MKIISPRIVGGLLLIAGGVLLLLQTLGVYTRGLEPLLAVLLGVAGAFFMYVFFTGPAQKWWAAIPGIILLDLTALLALGLVYPQMDCAARLGGLTLGCADLSGALFLAGIGLSFWVVYIANRAMWWAVIPGGVLLTLAVVAGLGNALPGEATGGLFFLGLGVTFLLVGLLPAPQGRLSWAFIPAVILLALGVFIVAARTSLLNYVWAVGLMGVGAFLLVRALRRG